MCVIILLLFEQEFSWFTGDPLSTQLWPNKYNKMKIFSPLPTQFCSYKNTFESVHRTCCCEYFPEPMMSVNLPLNEPKKLLKLAIVHTNNSELCVMMNLANLAYPEWISINCSKKFYIDIVCMENYNNTENYSASFSPSLTYCLKANILKNSFCHEFIYFNGRLQEYGLKRQMEIHMNFHFIKLFHFILLAVNTFPTILSLQNDSLTSFYYIRYYNVIQTYHKNYPLNESEGFFIRRTNAMEFFDVTLYDNLHQCDNGEFIAITEHIQVTQKVI